MVRSHKLVTGLIIDKFLYDSKIYFRKKTNRKDKFGNPVYYHFKGDVRSNESITKIFQITKDDYLKVLQFKELKNKKY